MSVLHDGEIDKEHNDPAQEESPHSCKLFHGSVFFLLNYQFKLRGIFVRVDYGTMMIRCCSWG